MAKYKRHTRRRQGKKKQGRKYANKTRRMKGGGTTKTFSFSNRFHFGDNILNLKFLFNISEILKKRGIKINYYFKENYNKNGELDRFVDNGVVTLLPIIQKPADAIELWMRNPTSNGLHYIRDPLDRYYRDFYEDIVNKMGLQGENINTSLYQQEPYLQDIYDGLDVKYKDLDILIINAVPKSGQLSFNKDIFKEKFDAMCLRLKDKYKVAVTTCIDDSITCTMKDNLMLKDIGAISTHAKYIIAVHSGPLMACFNSRTQQNVNKWILFTDRGTSYEEINSVVLKSDYNLDNIEEHLT